MFIKNQTLWILLTSLLTILHGLKKSNYVKLSQAILFIIAVLFAWTCKTYHNSLLYISILAIILVASVCFYHKMSSKISKIGVKVGDIIKKASFTYVFQQYTVIAMVMLLAMPLIYFCFDGITLFTFCLGSFVSLFSSFIGMHIGTTSNVLTLNSVSEDVVQGAKTAVYSGAVCSVISHSMCILAIIGAAVLKTKYNDSYSMVGLAIGSALVSMFARLGGGIFTKSADVGADLIGKNEFGLDEDDPRNPGTIADNVGDNVGDLLGMNAELVESYISGAGAIYLVNQLYHNTLGYRLFLYILLSGVISAIGSTGIFSFSTKLESMMDNFFITNGILLTTAGLIGYIFKILNKVQCFSIGFGVISVLLFLKLTSYYTEGKYHPIKFITKSSKYGHGTNVIAGLSIGLESAAMFIGLFVLLLLILFGFGGSIVTFALTVFSFSPAILIWDVFGPISDNAGGIAELSKCPKAMRSKTDKLDVIGNTTKAVTKGYACISTILSAICLFQLFVQDILKLFNIKLLIDLNSLVPFLGLLLGTIIPYVFSSLAIRAVSDSANGVASKIREQFKNPAILKGEQDPDIQEIIKYLTKKSIYSMILPCGIPIILMILLFFMYKYRIICLSNFLTILGTITLGATISSVAQSIFMSISGGAWDNAKKHIESTKSKEALEYSSAITGDTVGDPLKDTSGPALCSLAKFINILSLIVIFACKSH